MKKLFQNTHDYAMLSVELPDGRTISLSPKETIYIEESYVKSYGLIQEVNPKRKQNSPAAKIKRRNPKGPSAEQKNLQKVSPVESEKTGNTPNTSKNGGKVLQSASTDYSDVVSFLSPKNDLLSILILSKDGYENISRCVASIREHLECSYEVIIGDTGTEDEEVWDFYETLPSPQFRVVELGEYHFARNNNTLAKEYAKGDWLLFLNNDVFFLEDSVSEMLDYIRIYRVGAVGLRLVFPNNDLIEHDGQRLINPKTDNICLPGHVNHKKSINELDRKNEIEDGATGACLLTRRDLFEKAGGLDEGYVDVYQDCDYCMKLKNVGLKSMIVKDSFGYHVGSATRGNYGVDRASIKRDLGKYNKKWNNKIGNDEKVRFSFITCVNDKKMYLNMVNSLYSCDMSDVEIIPIYNFKNYFSITEGLNIARDVANGDYIVYCHQDIIFSATWKSDFEEAARQDDEFGVMGVEGISQDENHLSGKNINQITSCKILDEMCLIIRSNSGLTFDERQKFHFYGADVCMRSLEMGMKNYVIPTDIEHKSNGVQNVKRNVDDFKKEAKTFWDKWQGRLDEDGIRTTTTKFDSNGNTLFYILQK